ncbi:MAG: Gfo/Idh/MocA family oxidoreductase [Verrucomicrobia bacterium]|jgi:predicted dehydrogenase|nr:Gfo/Idh/MocA family oxidoreductase [Verrucomicrobiota bacterium]
MSKNTPSLSRRKFLGASTLLAGGLLGAPQILRSETLGNATKSAANSRLGFGFIGTGQICTGHLKSFSGMKLVQPVAVCDVRTWQIEKALGTLGEKGYTDVASTAYYEEVIGNPAVDVVCVTTPDHWHAAIAIEAMKAGKDVYVEKPITLTIEEGKAVVAAEKKYGRILQVGSQQRSSVYFRTAANLVRNGMIGDIQEVQCRLGSFPEPPENPKVVPVPDGFDYDRWLGPTKYYEYSEHRVKGDYRGGWRCYWDYGNRKFGDWGAHHFDIVQWALNRDKTGPVAFIPKGFEGAGHHHFRYADGISVFRDKERDQGHQIRFIGTEGEVLVKRGGVFTRPKELVRHRFTDADDTVYESKNHRRNFIDSVISREKPICPAEVGHRSNTICALAAIAERLGRPVQWDPEAQQVVGDQTARAMQNRPRRTGYELPELNDAV